MCAKILDTDYNVKRPGICIRVLMMSSHPSGNTRWAGWAWSGVACHGGPVLLSRRRIKAAGGGCKVLADLLVVLITEDGAAVGPAGV